MWHGAATCPCTVADGALLLTSASRYAAVLNRLFHPVQRINTAAPAAVATISITIHVIFVVRSSRTASTIHTPSIRSTRTPRARPRPRL